MKKQEFLEELKRYLYVLEDEEQEDILQEYEQHIEMKIEKGLNEEEAIGDFGSVRELAKEILEAYHVKPDARESAGENTSKKLSKKLPLPSVLAAVHTIKVQGKRAGKKVLQGVAKLWLFLRKCAGKPFKLLKKPLQFRKEHLQSHQEEVKCIGRLHESGQEVLKNGADPYEGNRDKGTEKIKKKQMKKRMIFPMMARGIRSVCYGIFCILCWCGRLVWNCGVVCATVFSALIGLVFLYLFGMMFILWNQGYPLGGIVLGCMGAVLCFLSLAVFGSTFFRKKRQVLVQEKDIMVEGKSSIPAGQVMETNVK